MLSIDKVRMLKTPTICDQKCRLRLLAPLHYRVENLIKRQVSAYLVLKVILGSVLAFKALKPR